MNTIKCPKCGAEVEITEALKRQLEEQIISSLETKHKADIEEIKKQVAAEAGKEALEKYEFRLATLQKEKDGEAERSKKLTYQIDGLLEEIRKLREKDEDREIEMKKKLLEEEARIGEQVRKKAEQEHQLKDLEKDKIISDLKKALEEAQRKASQGSQQTQGETLEIEVESRLKAEFPADKISEIKKGQRGADILQEVVDKLGRSCGAILWESKNAQWANEWIVKLREDQRQAKANLAVLVTANLPEGIESFAYREGIWVASWKHFIPHSWVLRFYLVSLYRERQVNEGRDEKMKILYQYLTGTEFKLRVEGIVEAFSNLQEELEKEKRYFSIKWARQEKEIRKVIDQTHGMYGDLQGVIGKSLPEIKMLELPSGDAIVGGQA
jgi:hypothetical protein